MMALTATASKSTRIPISFSQLSTKLRIVIATLAFGMGLDCPNVRCIIHWGPSSDAEAYIYIGAITRLVHHSRIVFCVYQLFMS